MSAVELSFIGAMYLSNIVIMWWLFVTNQKLWNKLLDYRGNDEVGGPIKILRPTKFDAYVPSKDERKILSGEAESNF